MAVGKGPGFRADLQRLNREGLDGVETLVEVLAPYGVRGLAGSYTVQTTRGGVVVSCNRRFLPGEAIEPHLPQHQFEVDEEGFVKEIRVGESTTTHKRKKALTLEPDRWGRSWRSEFLIRTPWGIDPPKLNSGNDPVPAVQPFLADVCDILNRLINAYSFVCQEYDQTLIEPGDFPALKATYLRGSKYIGSFEVSRTVYLWWRGPTPLDEAQRNTLQEELRRPALPIHWDLYVSSRRKRALGDHRAAVVDSISAVEAAVTQSIVSVYRSRDMSQEEIDYHLSATLSVKRRVDKFLPAVLGRDALGQLLKQRFETSNACRNGIVHRGESASEAEAAAACDVARDILICLKPWLDG